MTTLSKEKDELLAHMQARTLRQRHRQKKKLQFASNTERKREQFPLLPVYAYMCNYVMVTLLLCLLLLFTSEQIDFLLSFFLFLFVFSFVIYKKHMYKKKQKLD
jgi:L-asparagine transporter-like permease